MRINLILTLFALPALLLCQDAENSPYSRYGLGDFANPSFSGFRTMGNATVAMYDRFHLNLNNPASIGEAGTGMFEVAADAKKSTYQEGSNAATQWSGGLDYIALGFPLKNPLNEIYETKKRKYKLGMAFCLNRFTKLSYSVVGTDSIANVGNFTRSYVGDGGTYKFQWANGISFKNVSFGVSLGYLFGGIQKSRSIVFEDLEYAFDDYITSNYHIKALTVQTGLLYHIRFNEKQALENANVGLKKLTFGLTYDLPAKFWTTGDYLEFSQQTLSSGAVIRDTIEQNPEQKGVGHLPGTIGFGLAYFHGEKTAYTAEIKSGNWSSYFNEATGEEKNDLQNSLSISVGGYVRPNYKSFTSFWKRVFYKYGAYYQKDPRIIGGETLTNYGLTFGLTMPFVFQRRASHTDIGFELGKSGQGTIIQENFFKINFGFTFNDDEWFIKRKYN